MIETLKQAVRSIGPLHRAVNRLRGNRIHEPDCILPNILRIGSTYGGWCLDPARLNCESVVYAVGVGKDISFDLGLIELLDCEVHAFDPTPIAVDWIARQTLPEKFHFHAIGLGAQDAEAEFQLPSASEHSSYSLTAASDAALKGVVTCPVRRLATIMAELGHDRIDLLKMDIEGFEYGVVDDLISSGVRPEQLLIEFHHSMYAHDRTETERAVNALRRSGYGLFWISNVGHEYGFVTRERVRFA